MTRFIPNPIDVLSSFDDVGRGFHDRLVEHIKAVLDQYYDSSEVDTQQFAIHLAQDAVDTFANIDISYYRKEK